MSNVDGDEPEKSLMFFGRDLTKIPCFRKTFLYSISGGIGTGLVFFLFTSRVGMSTHVGFGSFVGLTLTYWFYCRYQWSKNRFAISQLQYAMQQQAMYEGTEVEKRMKERLEATEKPQT